MKKFGSIAIQTFALTTFLTTAHNAISQQAVPRAGSAAADWLEIRDCLLEVEHAVSVPVQETGVLQSLEVKLNDAVASEQLLARLDNRKATSEFEQLKKEYASAREQAQGDSAIKLQENVLRTAEENLANYEAIGDSVNKSEIKQRRLAAQNAELSLRRAKEAKVCLELEAARIHEAMKAAELKLQHAAVKAPLAGIVSEIFQQRGEWVQAGQPLLTISDLEHLVVHAHVPSDQIDRSQLVGSIVQVESTTDHGAPIRLAGTVSSYDPRISSRGQIRIHAQVRNVMTAGHWQILPGKQVTLLLAVPAKAESFNVPHSQTAAR